MSSTASPFSRLHDYIDDATIVYRKGEVLSETTVNGLRVVTIDNFPALPEGLKTGVDCHFVTVGFTEKLAEWDHQEFYDAVIAAGQGSYVTMTKEIWAQGPSYITIGAWIGDQTTAFRFMACVQAHGLGRVLTPATLGITDPAAADASAGGGMVMLTGLKDPSTVEAVG